MLGTATALYCTYILLEVLSGTIYLLVVFFALQRLQFLEENWIATEMRWRNGALNITSYQSSSIRGLVKEVVTVPRPDYFPELFSPTGRKLCNLRDRGR